MINYRKLKTEEDINKASELWAKQGRDVPSNFSFAFGAFNEEDEMIGCVFLQNAMLIEGLISENPLSANVLVEKAIAVASTVTDRVYALIEDVNPKWNNEVKKYGFTEIGTFKKLVRII